MDLALIGYCGVDCAACDDLTSGKCPGCRKTEWPADDPCPPAGCCARRKIPFCGDCGEFPCGMMRDFYEESDSHRAARDRMARLAAPKREK